MGQFHVAAQGQFLTADDSFTTAMSLLSVVTAAA
jgi:hypothetical protein